MDQIGTYVAKHDQIGTIKSMTKILKENVYVLVGLLIMYIGKTSVVLLIRSCIEISEDISFAVY